MSRLPAMSRGLEHDQATAPGRSPLMDNTQGDAKDDGSVEQVLTHYDAHQRPDFDVGSWLNNPVFYTPGGSPASLRYSRARRSKEKNNYSTAPSPAAQPLADSTFSDTFSEDPAVHTASVAGESDSPDGHDLSASNSPTLAPHRIPCEFVRYTGCSATFDAFTQTEEWIHHELEEHLRWEPPIICLCWFCHDLEFTAGQTAIEDRTENFRARMLHIARHFREGTVELMQPDHHFLDHIWKSRLIGRETFEKQLYERMLLARELRLEGGEAVKRAWGITMKTEDRGWRDRARFRHMSVVQVLQLNTGGHKRGWTLKRDSALAEAPRLVLSQNDLENPPDVIISVAGKEIVRFNINGGFSRYAANSNTGASVDICKGWDRDTTFMTETANKIAEAFAAISSFKGARIRFLKDDGSNVAQDFKIAAFPASQKPSGHGKGMSDAEFELNGEGSLSSWPYRKQANWTLNFDFSSSLGLLTESDTLPWPARVEEVVTRVNAGAKRVQTDTVQHTPDPVLFGIYQPHFPSSSSEIEDCNGEGSSLGGTTLQAHSQEPSVGQQAKAIECSNTELDSQLSDDGSVVGQGFQDPSLQSNCFERRSGEKPPSATPDPTPIHRRTYWEIRRWVRWGMGAVYEGFLGRPRDGHCYVGWNCRCGQRLRIEAPECYLQGVTSFAQEAADPSHSRIVSVTRSDGSSTTQSLSTSQALPPQSDSPESHNPTSPPSITSHDLTSSPSTKSHNLTSPQSNESYYPTSPSTVPSRGSTPKHPEHPPGTKRYLLLCVNSSPTRIMMRNIDLTLLGADEPLFRELRRAYEEMRGAYFHNPFVVPRTIQYVKFELIVRGKTGVCVGNLEPGSIPPEKEVIDGRYAYRPCPPGIGEYPMHPNVFMHSFLEPGDHTRSMAVERLPKKMHSDLCSNDDPINPPMGWGIYIIEGFNWDLIKYVVLAAIAATFCLTLGWGIVMRDVQGGTGIGSFTVAIVAFTLSVILLGASV